MSVTIFDLPSAGSIPRVDWLEVDSGPDGGTSGRIAIIHGPATSTDADGNPTPSSSYAAGNYPGGSIFIPTGYPSGIDGAMVFRARAGAWEWIEGFYRGSNNNGEYQRSADGTQECWTELNMGSRTNSGAGTYADPYRTSLMDWTFPVEFTNLPQVFLTHKVGAGATARAMTPGYAFRTTTQARDIQVVAVTSSSSSENVYLDLSAKGSWR